MATQTPARLSTKKAFKKKPAVPAVDLQPMYGCTFKKDTKYSGYKIGGFPSFQVEGTVTNIFISEGEKPRYDISIDVADAACEALKTSLTNSVVPHFLNIPLPTRKDGGQVTKKIKLDPSHVKLPVREIDSANFEAEKKFWGVNVSAYGKTPILKFDNGTFVSVPISELVAGDEVQVTCFLSMYDYVNADLERRTGITLVASNIVLEHKPQAEKVEGAEEEVPPAFVITWKGQTYSV